MSMPDTHIRICTPTCRQTKSAGVSGTHTPEKGGGVLEHLWYHRRM